MPSPKAKREVVMQSTVIETASDPAGLMAAGRFLSGMAGDDRLDVARAAGGPTREGWWVEGGAGVDALFGSDGADVLAVSGIRLRFSRGDDLATVRLKLLDPSRPDGRNAGEQASGGGGDDLVVGAGGNDRLHGDDGNDILFGFGGNDMLFGGDGDDLLDGGFGRNLLDGGEGIDTASWAWITGAARVAPPGVVLNLSGEAILVGSQGGRATVQDLAGATIGTAGRMINNKHAELTRVADDESARFGEGAGRAVAEIDTLVGIERFEGTGLANDIAVLDAAFARGGTDAGDGWTAYGDGASTIWLRGFEWVLFA